MAARTDRGEAGTGARDKGQLAIDILTGASADGLALDFACGDEVYGSCTELRAFPEDRGQAYVLRVGSSFLLTLAAATTVTCAEAAIKRRSDGQAPPRPGWTRQGSNVAGGRARPQPQGAAGRR